MKRIIAVAVIVVAVGSCLAPAQQAKQNQLYFMQAQPGARIADTDVGYAVVMNGVDFLGDGKTVKGSPYSADYTTETTQMLADGNRITHASSSKIYRDNEGRTRRELGPGAQHMTLATIQPVPAVVGNHSEVLISDPVAGVSYSLDPEARTARKMPLPKVITLGDKFVGDEGGKVTINARRIAVDKALAAAGDAKTAEPFIYTVTTENPGETSTESLGTRSIEGVEAEGKRTTTTIPAGKIGNELPIVITQETWFSPKLQTVVLSTRHDPRFGDTTYRLANINLSEPAASLFQVPSDYTVTDVKSLIERERTRVKNEKDRFD